MHWTEQIPKTVADLDRAAEALCGSMLAGARIPHYREKMGMLYDLRCLLVLNNRIETKTFAELFQQVDDSHPLPM